MSKGNPDLQKEMKSTGNKTHEYTSFFLNFKIVLKDNRLFKAKIITM